MDCKNCQSTVNWYPGPTLGFHATHYHDFQSVQRNFCMAARSPQIDAELAPDWPCLKDFQQVDSTHKSKQQIQFNQRHCTTAAWAAPTYFSVGKDRKATSTWTDNLLDCCPILWRQLLGENIETDTTYVALRFDNSSKTDNDHFRFDKPVSLTISPECSSAAEPRIVEAPMSPIRTHSMTGTAIRLPRRYTNTCTSMHHTDPISYTHNHYCNCMF